MSEEINNSADCIAAITNAKKICNNIQYLEKRGKKQAFLDLRKIILDPSSTPVLRDLFNETQMYILGGFRDNSEMVRETAIDVMWEFVDRLPINDYFLTYIFPVIVERIGTVELIEESEEIRLHMILFLIKIIEKYSNTKALRPFINEMVQIFGQTVLDKFPDAKEETCKGIRAFAAALPNEFHYQAENLIKPVLTAFSHQRYKVRVEAIKCIGEIIMHSTGTGLELVVTPMAERLFDQIPVVRRTISQVAARWLREYRDRYSYWYKLLPLILTGLNDDVPETREEAQKLWSDVGLQYQQENEKDLKDKLDYLYTPPSHYPPYLQRPNLGCRELVQQNIIKLAAALSRELGSWQDDVRFRCSQLLCSLVLHAEDNLTHNLQDLLPAMYMAARDEDQRIVCNVLRASEYIGYFIPVKTWMDLVVPAIENGVSSGTISVLARIILGTENNKLVPHLDEITKVIADREVCCTYKAYIQMQLIDFVKNILQVAGESSASASRDLFVIIVTVYSLKDDKGPVVLDLSFLKEMAKTMNLKSDMELWKMHTDSILQEVKRDVKIWTINHPDRCIFETVILNSGVAFGQNLPTIGEILTLSLDNESDPESKLKIFMALSVTLQMKDEILQNAMELDDFLQHLVKRILVPNLVWHAGRVAEAMRTITASCLCSALSPGLKVNLFPSSEVFRSVYDELTPLLVSLTEDASYRSRQMGLEALGMMKQMAYSKECWTLDDLKQLYQVILNRFDDPTDKVRVTAIKTLGIILENAPKEFTQNTYQSHHELLADSLLTHFDDDDPTIQELILDDLKNLATINDEFLCTKVTNVKPILRNQEGCDKLLAHMKELKITDD